jgi:hypothetical protein
MGEGARRGRPLSMLTVAERLALRTGNAGKVVVVGETAELGGAVGLVGLREVVLSILGGWRMNMISGA